MPIVIDTETFRDLAFHLRLASESVIEAARRLSEICTAEGGPSRDPALWVRVAEHLGTVNDEVVHLAELLQAVLDANQAEDSPSPT